MAEVNCRGTTFSVNPTSLYAPSISKVIFLPITGEFGPTSAEKSLATMAYDRLVRSVSVLTTLLTVRRSDGRPV